MRVCRPKRENDELIDHDACGVGFIAQIGSEGTRDVVERALTALARLSHRGGVDSDGSSGDGAGLLTPIPKQFIRKRLQQLGVALPDVFGMGMAFMPQGRAAESRAAVQAAAQAMELHCLGWRVVPTNVSLLGPGSLCSLSSAVVVYKGLLTPVQLRAFYPDLADPEFTAPFAVFHQRYSTNTSPSWQLAQPFRLGAHNGEINTISANRRWMHARESALWEQFGADDCFHALEEKVSDSASLDNAVELLLRQGFTLAEALLRLVPPAGESDRQMPEKLRAFLSRSARDQEPWDGPAALVFSDGRMVRAKLDRNGLRPMRYILTSDGLLVWGSEVGLTDLRGKKVIERNRLGPGEILVVDSADGRIFRGAGELVDQLSGGDELDGRVYRDVARVRSELTTAPTSAIPAEKMAAAMGWTDDQFRLLFQPLAHDAKEAIWSVADDAPPAYLSTSRRALWDYCKQRFAQVTNPPIDPLREAHVMSLDVYLGRDLVIDSPVLDAGQTAVLENLLLRPVHIVDLTFYAADGVQGAQAAIERIRDDIAEAMTTEPAMILLTDRDATEKRAAVPVLLAVAAAWKEIVRSGGHRIPIVVETGQVIETHHLALLIAVGASAVCPYLAMELAENVETGGAAKYRVAVEAGFRKVLARMGISTVASYPNRHLFEQ